MIGHGSREKGFQASMEKVVSDFKKDRRFAGAVCAYLEIAKPSIEEAIRDCVKKGAAEIRLLPYFLLSGRHVNSHIPAITAEARKKYGSAVKIVLCPYLGYDAKIAAVAKKRACQGE